MDHLYKPAKLITKFTIYYFKAIITTTQLS